MEINDALLNCQNTPMGCFLLASKENIAFYMFNIVLTKLACQYIIEICHKISKEAVLCICVKAVKPNLMT